MATTNEIDGLTDFDRRAELINQLFERANTVLNVLIIHIRMDEKLTSDLCRIAELSNDEAIKVSLLELVDIAHKQRNIFIGR